MTISCSHCTGSMDPQWSFCPHCGSVNAHPQPLPAVPAQPEKAPTREVFGGLFFGFIAAPVCIIVGIMLCCTGLGAIAGIPLIALGILAPLIGPLLGLSELRGNCPWCGTRIRSILNHKDGFCCHACSRKIEVRNERLVKAA